MTAELTVDEIRAAVQEWGVREPLLVEAHLFGSFARGQERPDSDVDLAIVTRPEGLLGAFGTYSNVADEWTPWLERRLGRVVQLQPLSFTPEKIQPAVERDGIRLWP